MVQFIAGYFGPISWKNETELFLWKQNPADDKNDNITYSLCFFDMKDNCIYPYLTQNGKVILENDVPFACMAFNSKETKVAYWHTDWKFGSPITLSCVDLQTGVKTQMIFVETMTQDQNVINEYKYKEETFYVPYYYYIPSIFFIS